MKDDLIDHGLLAEDYFDNLHQAHYNMRNAFELREEENGLTQDRIATVLGVDKSLVSKRFSGRANLTLKTLSHIATALRCKLNVEFVPHENIVKSNAYSTSFLADHTKSQAIAKRRYEEHSMTEARYTAIGKSNDVMTISDGHQTDRSNLESQLLKNKSIAA